MKRILSLILLLLTIFTIGCGRQEEEKNNIEKHDKNTVVLAAYRHLAPGNKD